MNTWDRVTESFKNRHPEDTKLLSAVFEHCLWPTLLTCEDVEKHHVYLPECVSLEDFSVCLTVRAELEVQFHSHPTQV